MEARILLVEDTISDAELIQEAFKDSEFQHHLDLVNDGEEALVFIRYREEKPHLVLLDLNLPKKSGLDVLREIRNDPDPFLRSLPIIILTNSRSRKDILKAYTYGCNAYVRKPLSFEKLLSVIQATGQFWFNCAIVPEVARTTSDSQPRSSDYPPPPKRKRKRK